MKKRSKEQKLIPLRDQQRDALDRLFDECDPKTALGTVGNPYPVAPITRNSNGAGQSGDPF